MWDAWLHLGVPCNNGIFWVVPQNSGIRKHPILYYRISLYKKNIYKYKYVNIYICVCVLKSDPSNADPREGHDETASKALWGVAGPPSLLGTVPWKQVNVK